MVIGIAGLGLIGGSMAKAGSAAGHRVLGDDMDSGVTADALSDGVIAGLLDRESSSECEMFIIALNPNSAVEYVRGLAPRIARGTVVIDCCGVKRYVLRELEPLAAERGFHFLGGHPMAGREYSGYAYSSATLFRGASMILTPSAGFPRDKLDSISRFFVGLGFGEIKISTPEEHDRKIAYTSQLAHIISNAYVKSPTAKGHEGFSAGSFRDLTRVAYLNEGMWSELFRLNADALTSELDALIWRLSEYSEAIKSDDGDRLLEILREGRLAAEEIRKGRNGGLT